VILIIGSSGFIGHHLLAKFKLSGQSYLEMNSLNGGILNTQNFNSFRNKKIKRVIHLGAKAFVPESWKLPLEYLDCIAIGTRNVLDFCLAENSELLYVSSYVYGQQSVQPIDEAKKVSPGNPYAHSKIIAEEFCKYYSQYLNIPLDIVRPFNIYGPGQSEKFLIPKLIAQVISGSKQVHLDNTVTRRDYIHVEDFAEILFLLSKSAAKGKVYNAGTGESHSVREVVNILEEVLNTKLEIKTNEVIRPNEILECVADITLLKSEIKWEPKIKLKQGLIKTIHMQRHYNEEKKNGC